MNKVILLGNVSKDIEVKEVGEHKVGRFSIAVNRKFKKDETDFLNCVVWDKQVDLVQQYFPKGSKMLLGGRIEARQYKANDGTNRTSVEIVVEEIEFVAKNGNNEVKEAFNTPQVEAEQPTKQLIEEDTPFLPF